MTISTTIPRGRIGELVPYFLRLGLLGFGGPVALVGQMERELVAERGWLTKEQMREAIAICQSLPGPLAMPLLHPESQFRYQYWFARTNSAWTAEIVVLSPA
jgi:chromate transporter